MKGINKYLVALVIVFQVQCKSLLAQTIFYQDIFYGGVTGAGFSVCLGAGSGTIPIYIEPGSTIRKAFLISYRIGDLTPAFTCTFNSNPITFYESPRISGILNNYLPWGPNFSIHAIDATYLVSAGVTSYSIDIPVPDTPMACLNCRYNSVFLVVLYENPTLSKTNFVLINNNKDNDTTVYYNLSNLNPINNINDVGLSIYSDRMDDILIFPLYGSNLYINSDTVGILGGTDSINSGFGCGVKGHFYYQDSTLYGLDDDTPDSIMYRSDGLADIKSYVNYGDTSMLLVTDYRSYTNPNMYTDFFLTFHLAYTTPCDTFTADANYNDTTFCYGDSAMLSAYGGIKYKWKPSIGLSCDTCANPFAKPDSSTLYTVQIFNTDSCSKVFPIKVNVRPPISFNTTTIPTTCGLQDGSITITNIVNATAPFTYIINGAPQPTNIFTALDTGMYLLSITDSNACKSVQVVVVLNDTNYVTANFSSIPITGVTPLDVNFNYTGNNGTNFIWSFGSGDSSFINNPNYVFNNAGSFIVTLITWANDSTCSDTASATLLVSPALVITQFVSPNNDGQNDTWIIQGLSLYPKAGVEIFNRWGNLVYSSEPYQNDWAGECAEPTCIAQGGILPTGTYFYYLYLNGKSNTSANEIKSGYLELQP